MTKTDSSKLKQFSVEYYDNSDLATGWEYLVRSANGYVITTANGFASRLDAADNYINWSNTRFGTW